MYHIFRQFFYRLTSVLLNFICQVRYVATGMQGWRRSMEDSHITNTNLAPGISLFGVFDGHGGKTFFQIFDHFDQVKKLPYMLKSTTVSFQPICQVSSKKITNWPQKNHFLKLTSKCKQIQAKKNSSNSEKVQVVVMTTTTNTQMKQNPLRVALLLLYF